MKAEPAIVAGSCRKRGHEWRVHVASGNIGIMVKMYGERPDETLQAAAENRLKASNYLTGSVQVELRRRFQGR